LLGHLPGDLLQGVEFQVPELDQGGFDGDRDGEEGDARGIRLQRPDAR
jgi:hypothetical protein